MRGFPLPPAFAARNRASNPASKSVTMKNHHHQGHVAPTANSPTQIHEAIALRAYLLWEKAGKPENQNEKFWLQAERELVEERTSRKE